MTPKTDTLEAIHQINSSQHKPIKLQDGAPLNKIETGIFTVYHYFYVGFTGNSGGLLHSPPSDDKLAEKVVELANQCAKPPLRGNRIDIKTELMDSLEMIMKQHEKSS